MRKAIWFLMLSFALVSVQGQAAQTCGTKEISAGYSYDYCIQTTDRTKTQDVVYFFHGLGGNARTWFTQTQGTQWIEKKWSSQGYQPTIITISFGEIWLLVNNEEFPLITAFRDEMMPFLEGQIGGLGKGRRLLMGQSMGGFNSVQASLQMPGTFLKVVLMCPAITTVGPFDPPEAIERYIIRTKALRSRVNMMLDISREFFKTQEDWQRHDPLLLIKTFDPSIKQVYLVSTGMKDEFGFQEGSAEFVKAAKTQGVIASWLPVQGGHCVFDRDAVARFIWNQ